MWEQIGGLFSFHWCLCCFCFVCLSFLGGVGNSFLRGLSGMLALQTNERRYPRHGRRPKTCALRFPIALHERVSEERERLGQTTSEYITKLIQEYYNMMENQKGGMRMTEKGRTMAFQIPEELFQRIKRHLERESAPHRQEAHPAGLRAGAHHPGPGRRRG